MRPAAVIVLTASVRLRNLVPESRSGTPHIKAIRFNNFRLCKSFHRPLNEIFPICL
jgi:hypothetical protein